MWEFDLHTHSIASGHGTTSTITDMAKQAASQGLALLGVTDHAPAMPGAGHISYFRNLKYAPRRRCGVDLLYGVELNILDKDGNVDLPDHILRELDYAIVSMHSPIYKPGTAEENTFAYINAMKHPGVRIIGHCEDVKFPVDCEALVIAAKHRGVLLEINNSSLSPNGYRGDVTVNVKAILRFCRKHQHPVVLSSDSHGAKNVGNFACASEMIKKENFPEELVMNTSSEKFKNFLCNRQ